MKLMNSQSFRCDRPFDDQRLPTGNMHQRLQSTESTRYIETLQYRIHVSHEPIDESWNQNFHCMSILHVLLRVGMPAGRTRVGLQKRLALARLLSVLDVEGRPRRLELQRLNLRAPKREKQRGLIGILFMLIGTQWWLCSLLTALIVD